MPSASLAVVLRAGAAAVALVLAGRAGAQQAPAQGGAAAASAADPSPAKLDAARAALAKWVETKTLIGKEKSDWTVGKSVMTERIDLVKQEIEAVRAKIAEADKSIAANEGTKAELAAQQATLSQTSAALQTAVTDLERRTKRLLARLPEVVRDRVALFSQRIPEQPQETKATLADRYANVISVLNEVNKFDREVSVSSEVRQLPDGRSAQVRVLYVGIGQAYYVTADGKTAGIGTAGGDGWVWTPADEHAAAIARSIAVHQNEQPAAFVGVPVRIQQ